jgi:hypothetical protein
MQKPLIYLASPYSSEFADVIERRVAQVQEATAKLIEQGHLIFSPIVHTHPIADQVSFSPVNTDGAMSGWMKYDFAMIDKADELWVLRLSGYEKSRGVNAEIQHAFDTGKTIRYIAYPSLSETGKIINKGFSYSKPFRFSCDPGPYFSFATAASEALKKSRGVWDAPSTGKAKHKYTTEQADHVLGKIFGEKPSTKEEARRYKIGDMVRVLVANADFSPLKVGDIVKVADADLWKDGTAIKSACGWGLNVENIELVEEAAAEIPTGPMQTTSLPEDAAERNSYPIAEGVLYYFPNALAEVSKISRIGNEQHNAGQPMHWSRGKSTDHANKIIRHLIDAGRDDESSIAHAANMTWRALALLQEKIETVRNVPMPKNCWVDETDEKE